MRPESTEPSRPARAGWDLSPTHVGAFSVHRAFAKIRHRRVDPGIARAGYLKPTGQLRRLCG
jgi:hypothetical protein